MKRSNPFLYVSVLVTSTFVFYANATIADEPLVTRPILLGTDTTKGQNGSCVIQTYKYMFNDGTPAHFYNKGVCVNDAYVDNIFCEVETDGLIHCKIDRKYTKKAG